MNAMTDFSCQGLGLPRVEDVLSLLMERTASVPETESVPLAEAAGRILACNTTAALTVPPCDRSAMDGYAFRFDDVDPMRCIGSALAGKPFAGSSVAGSCIAIATGGTVPEGCDTVAMREHCKVTPGGVIASAKARGANVRHRGEDFQAGDMLLPSCTPLGARQIGLLAAAGVEVVEVRRRLRIALLSLGDELARHAQDGIRDSNRPMLRALCAVNGFQVTDLGILPDCRTRLADTLAQSAIAHDVILTTAGTASGDEDHIRGAVLDGGGRLHVCGVAIKPGKPVSFGAIGSSLVMALPGNSTAAYVTFLILGLPLLRHLAGSAMPPTAWQGIRAGFLHRKKSGVREYLRVRLTPQSDGTMRADRCGADGSAMMASLAAADGLVVLADANTEIHEGDLVPFASFAALKVA